MMSQSKIKKTFAKGIYIYLLSKTLGGLKSGISESKT